jgi:hypothetical protein
MKISLLTPLSIFLLLGFVQCTHKIAVDKMPTNQLIFGSGGGVTGFVKEYAMLEDGRILARSDDGKQYKTVVTVKGDDLANLKSGMAMLDKQAFNEPGNMYYFIETKGQMTGKAQRLIWGGTTIAPPTELSDFYKKLMAFVPKDK